MDKWGIKNTNDLYKISQWGLGYFSINEKGNLCIKPSAESDFKVDLKLLVDELQKRKINPPILIRSMDILKDRLNQLAESFNLAIETLEYQNKYYPLYPIKVNQQRQVVEAILKYGKQHGLGLEAGSKAELLVILALTLDPNTPIVCNGYKDQEFAELVAMAHKMGKNIFPVIEKYSELETFIKVYKETGIMPKLGMRVKLATEGAGQWAKSGGENSKFGLRITEVTRAIRMLKDENLLEHLKLLHFHLGSQVTEIKVIKLALVETTRLFSEMIKMGASLEYIDVGGGLGVDYDGSSNTFSSVNYSLQEYANDVIYRIMQICDTQRIAHPAIFSESGRFLAAHYSLLITNISTSNTTAGSIEESSELLVTANCASGPLKEMFDVLETMDKSNFLEAYHDAIQYRSQALSLFNLGYFSLPERATIETLFWRIMRGVLSFAKNMKELPEELAGLQDQLTDTYFANFSLFQSLPDAWAINQVFPTIPIHRLDEKPTRKGVIVDLTCDSDGIIRDYVGKENRNSNIRLHELRVDEPYYIGVFLIGAYQETLGELHNLFGDTHAVQIELTSEDQYKIVNITKGDTVKQVLDYVSYSATELTHKMRTQIETALERGKLTLDDSAQLMEQFEQGLQGYTYFED